MSTEVQHAEPGIFQKYFLSTDHKMIAMQYLFTGMAMALIGGFFAYVFRMQLGFPNQHVPGYGLVTPGKYNALVTMHGSIMIFWVAMPVLIAAFGNFLIPLMVGCDDMAFPRINRLSYQIFLLSALVLLASFLVKGGPFGGAWTGYPPLSAVGAYNLTPIGATLWLLAVALEFIAFLLGGINFTVTTMNSRAPGMKMYDIPLVVWMIVLASVIFMCSVGPLIAGAVMLLFDQTMSTGFYDPTRGGDPLLWQHLFWFFGHPEVYVVLLPALGIVAEVVAVFARKKIFGYKTVLYTTWSVGFLSFVVWAHHQFVAGIDPRMANIFSITTLLISVPITEMVFLYIATLYGGSIHLDTPMLWGLAFIGEFMIGGVTGIFLGSSGTDIYLHDSYFVIAHFHYTFVPIAIIAVYAGLTFWYPKMFGRMLNETLGKIHFWGTVIPFNVIFIPLFITGTAGDQRRVYSYAQFAEQSRPALQHLRTTSTIALLFMLAFQFVFIFNFFWSLRRGKRADANPWRSSTLEWTVPSPPPHGNFAELPIVYRGPYEYGLPGCAEDFAPQNVPDAALAGEEQSMSAGAKPIANTRSGTGIPTARLITWWVIASEIVIFGGLLASYVMHRIGHPEWAESASHTNTWAGAFNTFVLLTSSLCAVLAHKAADAHDGPRAARLLRLTALGGLIFLTVKGFEWAADFREGFVLSSGGFWSFYYTLAGLHGLHVLAGMIIMLIIASEAAKNQEMQRVECIGLYWHFVDIVWIFLFPLLYIAR